MIHMIKIHKQFYFLNILLLHFITVSMIKQITPHPLSPKLDSLLQLTLPTPIRHPHQVEREQIDTIRSMGKYLFKEELSDMMV